MPTKSSSVGIDDLFLENGAKPLDEIIQTLMMECVPAMRDDITILLARKF